MVERDQNDVRADTARSADRTINGEPLGESDSQHASVVANTAFSKGSEKKAIIREASANLERVCNSSVRCQSPSKVSQLGAVGEVASEAVESLHSEVEFRPSQFCRLLNSTTLGAVIDERQLYRHRMRSGDCISSGRKVNLLKFISWMQQRRKAPEKKSRCTDEGTISFRAVMNLIESQRFRCALTGRQLSPDVAALDHIHPISRDGRNEIANAQVLHRIVNRAKGALTNYEFIALCREVVEWADR